MTPDHITEALFCKLQHAGRLVVYVEHLSAAMGHAAFKIFRVIA
jgi:hypothetical protein